MEGMVPGTWKRSPGEATMFGRNLTAAFHNVRTSKPTSRGLKKNVRLYKGIDLSPDEKARQHEAEAERARRIF